MTTRSKMSRAILVSWFGMMAVGVGYLHEHVQAARWWQDATPTPRSQVHGSQPQPSSPVTPSVVLPRAVLEPRAVLDKYCVSCHNERLKTAGLTLDKMDVGHVSDGAELWEKVARKLRTREMPPPGRPRPDQATYDAMASRLENALDAAAATNPNPGRVAVHRLNRTEYANAIRDLL